MVKIIVNFNCVVHVFCLDFNLFADYPSCLGAERIVNQVQRPTVVFVLLVVPAEALEVRFAEPLGFGGAGRL